MSRITPHFYIGLSCTCHDPALAILNGDGDLVFAEACERPLQFKRAWDTPPDLRTHVADVLRSYCDKGSKLVLAKTWQGTNETVLLEMQEILQRVEESGNGETKLAQQLRFSINLNQSTSASVGTAGIPLKSQIQGNAVSFDASLVGERAYPHHMTHAAWACVSSPFEHAVCAVVDGTGDGTAVSFFNYQSGVLSEIESHSDGTLGGFYWTLCQVCGFDPYRGEEWKVMGLAPYGKFDPQLYQLFSKLVTVEGLNVKEGMRRDPHAYEAVFDLRRDPSVSAMAAANIAYTGQRFFEDQMTTLLNNAAAAGSSANLVFTGGCALNSSFNGVICRSTSFDKVFIPCAPADDGNAVGAALLAFAEDRGQLPEWSSNSRSPYLGSTYSKRKLRNLVQFGGLESKLFEYAELIEFVSAKLSAGSIVGWFQGRAEFGPRALGNRSILADPRDPMVKDRINETVKFREEFRPFAPSILDEFGNYYFEDYQDSPFMDKTLVIRESVRDRVPGIVHVDGTGRVQSVTRSRNPVFYDLINAFYERTGVPILLNTSFNVMGKPIVHDIEDAIAVFQMSGLDLLVIDKTVFMKERRCGDTHEQSSIG